MSKRGPAARRGFSLLEIVIALAIIAVLAAICIPLLSASQKRSRLKQAARDLGAHLGLARSLAGSGRGDASWQSSDRVVNGGVRLISPTQYAVFIDRNELLDGDEVDTVVVDFSARDPSSELRIVSPVAPAEIRFRANGTLLSASMVDVVVEDAGTGEQRTVRVTLGGVARRL